ncbi:MAG: choice-of-anchor Q domain-containing protein [Bacteroidales bacterium]|nr:choice-of-anchor Q domain-containing protein [Bacteroidales bacterium]
MKKIILLLALFCSLSGFSTTTYLVQLGTGGAATWRTAGAGEVNVDLTVQAKTLTAWLTATSFANGDQVWIAAGTYTISSVYTMPSASPNFTPSFYGGFAGTETDISQRAKGANVWNYTNTTTINGASSTTGIFNAGGDRSITIDGITFSGCPNNAGQVVYQRPGMIIQNCIFTANSCASLRYFISAASKTASTTNCYFSNNTYTTSGGTDAAGIMANNGSSGGTYTISGCVFDSNTSSASGSGSSAGIKAQGVGTTNISSCIFKNNSATAGGSSAVSLTSVTSFLTNSLIYGAALGAKSALYLTLGNVTNCTVVNNLGGAAYMNQIASAANLKLTNTVFWGADGSASSGSGVISAAANCLGTISNCAYNGLSANFISTPSATVALTTSSIDLFTDPNTNIWTLKAGSLLIDAGTSTGAPATDLIGMSRPLDSGFDIGAYEFDIITGVEKLQSDIICRTSKNEIILSGINANDNVSVYTLTGSRVFALKAVSTNMNIPVSQGIYLVKTANSVKKVIVQ